MKSPENDKRQWLRDVARCHVEIAEIERLLRAGHPDLSGLLLALHDWSAELRILNGESIGSSIRQSGRD